MNLFDIFAGFSSLSFFFFSSFCLVALVDIFHFLKHSDGGISSQNSKEIHPIVDHFWYNVATRKTTETN